MIEEGGGGDSWRDVRSPDGHRDVCVRMLAAGLLSPRDLASLRPSPLSLVGHLFDLSSLSGKSGYTAAYSEKGLVYISVCGENENCSPGVGKCRGLPLWPGCPCPEVVPTSALLCRKRGVDPKVDHLLCRNSPLTWGKRVAT